MPTGASRVITDDLLADVLADRHAAVTLPDLGMESATAAPVGPLPGPVVPFLRMGWARLQAQVPAGTDGEPLVSDRARVDLLRGLAAGLRSACSPAAILELNVARLEGALIGATPRERFEDFALRHLHGPQRLGRFFGEYPALAMRMASHLVSWLETTGELLERFVADRAAVVRLAGGAERAAPAIESLAMGLSDPHCGGRRVCRVELSGGSRVVYKPKSLAIDRRYQEMLAWLHRRGLRPSHRRLRILDRGTHGWVENVDAAPCSTRAQVERFYWRLGSQMALLYVLQAVDFHFENLVASGEFPVPVDLESLFHSRIGPPGSDARSRAHELLGHSVYSIGLLPRSRPSNDGQVPIDVSGMGGRSGDTCATRIPTIRDAFADTMHITPGDVRIAGSHNRPRLGDHEVDPADFADAVAEGFRATYQILAAHRAEFAVRLSACREAVVRYIPRDTKLYGALLLDARHPDYLRDSSGTERCVERIRRDRRVPEWERLWESEIADLRRGDVPYFSTRPGSRDLWDADGLRLPEFFAEDGLTTALRTLAGLGDTDLNHQLALIRQSLAGTESPESVPGPVACSRPSTDAGPVDAAELLAVAVSIGERLKSQAVLGDDDVTWIGLSLRDAASRTFELAPISYSLYEGAAGMALFFAFLGDATGRADFEDLARRALRSASKRLEGDTRIGGYSGRPSVVYARARIAALWGDPSLLEEPLPDELRRWPGLVAADTSFDLLAGTAGCAMVLLGLARERSDPALLECARACGERLLASAVPQARGLGWPVTVGPVPLAGFSHGAAGIAWTLFELGRALGEPRYRQAALRGWEFERSLYLPESRNWLDRRFSPPRPQDGSGWCHGGAGLALGRLLSLPHVDTPEVRHEIVAGVERTLAAGFGAGQSLCHGDLGNLDVLLLAAERLGRQDWHAAALGQAARVCRDVSAGRLRCGLPRFTETPSLMNGIAGIGYGLLRLWSRERVPAVLWLG